MSLDMIFRHSTHFSTALALAVREPNAGSVALSELH
jgi:hypothetical protein